MENNDHLYNRKKRINVFTYTTDIKQIIVFQT